MAKKRRILHKLKLTEISGVDRPCQSDAKVCLMKREPEEEEPDMAKIDELQTSVDGLKNQIADVTKQLESRADPLLKSGYGDTFDGLVAQEIARGCPASAAGQRVINRYGTNPPASALRKGDVSAVTDFMAKVNEVMVAKRCSRSAAMSEVRKRDPAAFQKYQEV